LEEIATIRIASLCNSPPDNYEISLSYNLSSSKSLANSSATFLSSFYLIISPTFPLTNLGIVSTYWGFILAFKLSSKTLVK